MLVPSLLFVIFFTFVASLDNKWIEYVCNVYFEAGLNHRAKQIIHHIHEKTPIASKLRKIPISDEDLVLQPRPLNDIFELIEHKNMEKAQLLFESSYKPSMKGYNHIKLVLALLNYDMNHLDDCMSPWDTNKKMEIDEKLDIIKYIQNHEHEKIPFTQKCQNIEDSLKKKVDSVDCIRILISSGDLNGLDEQITKISNLDLLTRLRGCLKQKSLSSCKAKDFYDKSSVLKLSDFTRAYISKIKPILENRCTWEEAVSKFRQTCSSFQPTSSDDKVQKLKELYCNINSTNVCIVCDKINSISTKKSDTSSFLATIKLNIQDLCKSSKYYYLRDSETREEIFNLSFSWSDIFHKVVPPKPSLSIEFNAYETETGEKSGIVIGEEIEDNLEEVFRNMYL